MLAVKFAFEIAVLAVIDFVIEFMDIIAIKEMVVELLGLMVYIFIAIG